MLVEALWHFISTKELHVLKAEVEGKSTNTKHIFCDRATLGDKIDIRHEDEFSTKDISIYNVKQ